MFRRLLARLRHTPSLLVPSRVREHQAKISAKGIGHTYGKQVVALEDVSLNIRSGEFVCLLGPSGCGKSTLLFMLAGHISPSGGSVSLDGRPIVGPGPERLLMFQEAALYPWFTVRGNILFPLGATKLSRREREARAARFIELVQLQGFENAMPHELSGGMKMRVSLARALAMDSSVLLMDEPFGSLDAQTREQMHELLQNIWMMTRKTVVFVTHDVHEALVLGTRVVVMAPRPGRVIKDLDLQLPFPRDPDDPRLAGLARSVRDLIRGQRLRAGEPAPSNDRRGPDGNGHQDPAESQFPAAAPGDLGHRR